MANYTIEANEGTDIWRKPPTTNDFTAPTEPPSDCPATNELSRFRSANISFRLAFKKQYDQAGLLMTLSPKDHGATSASNPPRKWIKTGIELYQGAPWLGTVACDTFSDWSIATASDIVPMGAAGSTETEWVTMRVVAEGDDKGRSFWVYRVKGEELVPLREVCWVAAGDLQGWELGVYAMAARPWKPKSEEAPEGPLKAEFKDFKIDWA